jgi:Na+-driven multidrug efflux pump
VVVMATGIQSALISLGSKKIRADKTKATYFFLFAGFMMALATALWTAIIYFMPLHDAIRAFGPTWRAARHVLPFMGMSFVFAGFSGASNAGLRSMRAAKENLNLAIAMLPFLFVPCMGGAALWGAQGFAEGLTVAQGIYAILGWTVFIKVARRFSGDNEDRSHDVSSISGISAEAPPSLA